jgi:kynureninase
VAGAVREGWGDGRLEELRSRFPILCSTTYLISNSLGAMPAEVEGSLGRYVDEWRTRGVRAWHEGWWELPVEVGDLVAPFLGVGRGEVGMHHNVTVATAVFLSCLDYSGERNGLVTTAHDFPSVRYLLEGERARGARIAVVPSLDGVRVELDELLRAIDERTRVVVTSHVLFRSSFLQDAPAIAARCREVGALLLLDVYQSAGTMPLELAEWGVDAAVGGCLKWLCGGPGNAFLWVRPGLDETLEPRLTGWQSDVEPFSFREGHRRVERGAWRFLTGTPNVPALYAAIPGLDILGALPLAAVRARSLELTGRLIDATRDAGFELRTPLHDAQRGGTVSVFHERAEELSRGLLVRDILCDYRPDAGVRLSPHCYSTEQECDRAVAALVELRAGL